ncbi:tRNA lysidine(34) synthetase TilS [Chelatococcus sp. SYSU_G07232]|uniref:tRNA(Ile)-lysidine synthase n=1 Tax=Chelatococcus albus TaxID=3047466 RepID=A0ABT7AFS9_9HYPH|nr:tRNA lysidine(34) synthetase TilS [Chelatococcus sp. SYSU_G07232]MDJ1158237.1 tRNA lysidine(34) synthetase TilS [Chelatococcus sp. SYSU_G07232]
MTQVASPLSPGEIADLCAPFLGASKILLAVSGGPDSLALLLIVHRWLRVTPGAPPVAVATVDHRLRSEAAAEAAAVAAHCRRLDLPHAVLVWEGGKPAHGLQEAAREARYRLLADHARAIGADRIVTAHHRDDQAETVLMRLARGSGVGGLAAMRPATEIAPGLVLLRPFLTLPKARLVATVAEAGLIAAEDASNRDLRFARAALRARQAARTSLGLTDERLARLAERAARAEAALEVVAATRHRALVRREEGRALIAAALFDEPAEIQLRVMRRTIEATAPSVVPLRLERLEALAAALGEARRERRTLTRSLAGTIVSLASDGSLLVSVERPRRRGRGS